MLDAAQQIDNVGPHRPLRRRQALTAAAADAARADGDHRHGRRHRLRPSSSLWELVGAVGARRAAVPAAAVDGALDALDDDRRARPALPRRRLDAARLGRLPDRRRDGGAARHPDGQLPLVGAALEPIDRLHPLSAGAGAGAALDHLVRRRRGDEDLPPLDGHLLPARPARRRRRAPRAARIRRDRPRRWARPGWRRSPTCRCPPCCRRSSTTCASRSAGAGPT